MTLRESSKRKSTCKFLTLENPFLMTSVTYCKYSKHFVNIYKYCKYSKPG